MVSKRSIGPLASEPNCPFPIACPIRMSLGDRNSHEQRGKQHARHVCRERILRTQILPKTSGMGTLQSRGLVYPHGGSKRRR